MKPICIEIKQRLYAMQDEAYRLFQAKLMPEVPLERIIGVRTPQLRALARELAPREDIQDFLNDLPHKTYDENNLHGFVIALGKDYAATLERVNAFLPYVDNWATCDQMRPRVFARHRQELKQAVAGWLDAEEPFTVRFGLEMILCHFLGEDFDPLLFRRGATLSHDAYYVNMMRAWLVATALAKQWDAALPLLREHGMDTWTHNKTIQKGIESYRLTAEQKHILRSMRIS